MQYFVEVLGTKQLQGKFSRLSAAAADARPAMAEVAALIMGIEEQIFNSQGRRGGGSWRNLTWEWMLRKSQRHLDPRINHATHALRESLTEPGAEGQVLHIARDRLIFGSSLPYAKTTQRNRPVIKFLPQDKAAMRNLIRDYLMAAWRA